MNQSISLSAIMESISEYAHEMGFEPVVNIDNFYGDYEVE